MDSTDRKSFLAKCSASHLFWPLLALVVLLGFNAVFVPSFFHVKIVDGHLFGSLVDVLNRGSIGVILAIGMTIVVATGGVDLSVGSVMAITGAVAALLLTETNMGFWGVITLAMLVSMFAGLVNGLLVSYLKIQPIIATLVLMVSGRGIAKFITGENTIGIGEAAFDARFDFVGNGHLFGLPFPVTVFVALFLATELITRRTSIGLFVEAVGANETASYAAGVNAGSVKVGAYLFAGFCAGIAGLIAASNIGAADPSNAGVFSELDAIFAVVVGGTALTGGRYSLLGSVIGAILLQTMMTTLYSYGVRSDVAPVPKAMVIVVVCLLQSPEFRKQFKQWFSRGVERERSQ